MKINVLRQRQNPFGKTVLYAPELELPEAVSVAERCYPAVDYNENFGMKFFLILESELGEYEEQSNVAGKDTMYGYFDGKEGLEKKFQEMYNSHLLTLK